MTLLAWWAQLMISSSGKNRRAKWLKGTISRVFFPMYKRELCIDLTYFGIVGLKGQGHDFRIE
jgi:hypothetical protein